MLTMMSKIVSKIFFKRTKQNCTLELEQLVFCQTRTQNNRSSLMNRFVIFEKIDTKLTLIF